MKNKIVHVIIACFYKEGYGYQENILPVKHKELGYDSYIITYNKDYPNGYYYVNADNIPVNFLPLNKSQFKSIRFIGTFCRRTLGLYEKLEDIEPNIIFVHGLQAIDNLDVCKYIKKHRNCKLFVDQHGDYYNMPIKPFRNLFTQKILFKPIAKKIEKYAEVFWGVSSWRVDYLQKVYNIKPEKTGLLVMGGDEKKIDWLNKDNIRKNIRDKYDIPYEAFLIVSGGKIDKAKNIHLLIEAVTKLKKDVYLLIFGNYTSEMENICSKFKTDKIINIGWLEQDKAYSIFLSGDLAIFPGTHSVLWEQACASGIPCVFKDWNGGFSHVDVGGNCILIKDPTVESLLKVIETVTNDDVLYKKMLEVSSNIARKTFSYIEIAKKSINYD